FVLPIFASARENSDQFKVSSNDIVKGASNLFNIQSNDQLINLLDINLKEGDVVFTMGAGDVYKLKGKLIEMINNKSSSFVKTSEDKQKLNIEKNKDLTFFNTLRTKTTAKYFLDAKTRKDLIEGKKFALKNKLDLFILAGGSNLAIVKDKINGLVIKNSYKQLKILKETDNDVLLSVSSGYPVSLLVNETVNKGYQGLEYHKGLPGTVGGAIYMNSKWTKPVSYFGDSLVMGYLVTLNGEIKQVDRKYFKFGYDYSFLQETKEILLEVVFKLKKVNPFILKKRSEEALAYRKKTQPMGEKTSGCFFKNVDGKSAGQMIDKVGLKGFSVGDFFVSPVHANFIINRGNGQSKDLVELVRIIKEKVRQKFGIELEEEVMII
ncbi:MAG: UDP-N-acetylmuramate dehydrogenase, partial [Patescibacteria group bacterium]